MFKPYPGEKFKKLKLHSKLRLDYAISNFGRMVSYTNKISDGNLVKGSLFDGYRSMGYKLRGPKQTRHKRVMYYKLVAENFLRKSSPSARFLIHLDHDKLNDHADNLKWVSRSEYSAHVQQSPAMKKLRKKIRSGEIKAGYSKLTRNKVIALKKQIINPRRKTKLSDLAKQYGISEMQLYRIKSGENWGHIKV